MSRLNAGTGAKDPCPGISFRYSIDRMTEAPIPVEQAIAEWNREPAFAVAYDALEANSRAPLRSSACGWKAPPSASSCSASIRPSSTASAPRTGLAIVDQRGVAEGGRAMRMGISELSP